MDIEVLIGGYLKEAKMMHLATEANAKPWVCNVWFAADDELNIYWFSAINRRHSEEVAKNPHVAGAMCLPQTPDDPPRGLQFEGTAEVLRSEADVEKAKSVYSGRIFPQEKIDELMAHPDRPHKFYRIKPALFVLFDAVNFPNSPRQEYKV